MRFTRGIDRAAFAVALYALFVALGTAVPALGVLLPLAALPALVAGIFLLEDARRQAGTRRTVSLWAGIVVLVASVILVIGLIGNTPFTFKGDPGARGVNTEPHPVFAVLQDIGGPLVLIVTAAALAAPWSDRLPQPLSRIAVVGGLTGAFLALVGALRILPASNIIGVLVRLLMVGAFIAFAYGVGRAWFDDEVDLGGMGHSAERTA